MAEENDWYIDPIEDNSGSMEAFARRQRLGVYERILDEHGTLEGSLTDEMMRDLYNDLGAEEKTPLVRRIEKDIEKWSARMMAKYLLSRKRPSS